MIFYWPVQFLLRTLERIKVSPMTATSDELAALIGYVLGLYPGVCAWNHRGIHYSYLC